MDATISRFIDGLKSQSEDTRIYAATELRRYIASDLQEAFTSNYAELIEDLCFELEGMLSRSDPNEKRGAILAIGISSCLLVIFVYGIHENRLYSYNRSVIGCLAEVDFSGIANYCKQFINLIHQLTTSCDLQLLVLGSRLLGEFGLLLPNDFVEKQIKQACDGLSRGNISNSEKEFHVSFYLANFYPFVANL